MEGRLNKNMESCCRLCRSSTEDLQSIYPYTSILGDLMDLHVEANDGLPKLLCEVCIENIEEWSTFKRTSQGNLPKTQRNKEGFKEVKKGAKREKTDDTDIVHEHIEVETDPMEIEIQPVITITYNPEIFEKEIAHESELDPVPLETVTRDRSPSRTAKIIDEQRLNMEILSPIENSYIEKCKAMINMFRSCECACHSINHRTMKRLMTHLRKFKIWFPVFTCYNCMITFTDRSTYRKHFIKCPNDSLSNLIKLSNLKKRTSLKTRTYQNYRCAECKIIFSFHEDFRKHVDEEHLDKTTPYNCSCQKSFNTLEEYKDHVYVSSMVEYYCDICKVVVGTLEQFILHAMDQHDESEGFSLIQDDNCRKYTFVKRKNKSTKRRISDSVLDLHYDQSDGEVQPRLKKRRTSKSETIKCLICEKVYSCIADMWRHFKSHGEIEEIKNSISSRYRCPDCEIIYIGIDWESHKQSHVKVNCSECEKEFLFQNELKLHLEEHSKNQQMNTNKNTAQTGQDNRNDSCLRNGTYKVKCDINLEICPTEVTLPQQETAQLASQENEGINSEISSRQVMDVNMSGRKRSNRRPSIFAPKKSNVQTRLNKEQLKCDTCGLEMPNVVALKIHRIENHGNPTAFLIIRCEPCNRQFENHDDYFNHMKLHEIVENENS